MTDTNHEHHKHNEHHDHHPGRQTNFTDPVCGMSTGKQGEFNRYDHDGKPYYFCSEHCLTKFKNDPQAYDVMRRRKQPRRAMSRFHELTDLAGGFVIAEPYYFAQFSSVLGKRPRPELHFEFESALFEKEHSRK